MSGAFVLAGSPAGGYHLTKTVTYGAAPGLGATREYFDYVIPEPTSRRIFFTEGSVVYVVNADTGEKVGTITGSDWKRVHGVALVPELNKGFITDGDAAAVLVFDLKTLKPTNTIKAEEDADWILYDDASKKIFAFNGSQKTSTVIDPVKEEVIKSIPLGGAPEQAYADGKGMIYDTLQSTNEIVAIDTKEMVVKSRFPTAPSRRTHCHHDGSQDAPLVCWRPESQGAGDDGRGHRQSNCRAVPDRRSRRRQRV